MHSPFPLRNRRLNSASLLYRLKKVCRYRSMFSRMVSHMTQVPAISWIFFDSWTTDSFAALTFPFSLSPIPELFSASPVFSRLFQLFASFSRFSIMWLSSIRACPSRLLMVNSMAWCFRQNPRSLTRMRISGSMTEAPRYLSASPSSVRRSRAHSRHSPSFLAASQIGMVSI